MDVLNPVARPAYRTSNYRRIASDAHAGPTDRSSTLSLDGTRASFGFDPPPVGDESGGGDVDGERFAITLSNVSRVLIRPARGRVQCALQS